MVIYELDTHHTRWAGNGAYFNLFAAAAALYRPRLLFPCYPPAIIKASKEPPTKRESAGYWRWIVFGEWLPLVLYGALSAVEGGTDGFGGWL